MGMKASHTYPLGQPAIPPQLWSRVMEFESQIVPSNKQSKTEQGAILE